MKNEIIQLLKREWKLELRNKYTIGGIILYMVATVFVILNVLEQENMVHELNAGWWNLLFWISVLFVSVNAIAKSFYQESQEKLLYLYTLFSPESVIISKMFYNYIFMFVLALLSWSLFSIWFGNPVVQNTSFFLLLIFGAGGLGLIFTMISSIASKAGNNTTLMAILSFPVILPLLVVLIRLSSLVYLQGPGMENTISLWIMLISLNVLILSMSIILFPYLWRE
ncbi:MAG: ABC transporter permease [Chitinophagaceae bacterium]|nr:MAG: ABC transporter permease [Chitinophagaceae bacterium]